ncbi:MAG: hypothetical protein A2143_04335 [Gallionellales bacterium RBG_16_57_15]|nr:MAG: hypothetical protein A2143_04335 [Gallionellales bacterium RBG_16_57_15]
MASPSVECIHAILQIKPIRYGAHFKTSLCKPAQLRVNAARLRMAGETPPLCKPAQLRVNADNAGLLVGT